MPQNTSLSLLGTPLKGMMSRSHPKYGSAMYRPEDNAYVQHYASELDLNSLYRNGSFLNINNYTRYSGSFILTNTFMGLYMNEPGTEMFWCDVGRTGRYEYHLWRPRIHKVSMRNDEPLSTTGSSYLLQNDAYNDFYTGYYYPELYACPQVVKWTADGTRIFIYCTIIWSLAVLDASGRSDYETWENVFLSAEVRNDSNGNPYTFSLSLLSGVNGAGGWDAWSIREPDYASNYSTQYSNVHGTTGGEPIDFQVTPDGTKLIYLYRMNTGNRDVYLTEVEFKGNAFDFGSTFARPYYSSGNFVPSVINGTNTKMQWTNVVKQLSMSGTPAASLGIHERGDWMGFNFTNNGKKIQAHTAIGWMFTYDLSTAYDISTMTTTPSGYRYFNPYFGNAKDRNNGDQYWYAAQWGEGDEEKFELNRAGVSFYNNQRSMVMSIGDGRPTSASGNRYRNSDDFGQLNAYFYGIPRF